MQALGIGDYSQLMLLGSEVTRSAKRSLTIWKK